MLDSLVFGMAEPLSSHRRVRKIMTDPEMQRELPLAYLFMVKMGPTHAPQEFEPMLRLLSRRFVGEVWSYGSYEGDFEYGRFSLHVMKERPRLRLTNYPRFVYRVLRRARELQPAVPTRAVVTSYDPFKGGLLAWRVARILRCSFSCEVNGVYGDPDDFAHIKSALARRIRLLLMSWMAAFVLRRATSVRLLFAEQLDRFVKPRAGAVMRHFFALSHFEQFRPGREEDLILSAGYPFEIKGVDVLAAAFIRLAPRFPTWRLVLIGHLVPDQLRARGLEHPQILALPGMPQSRLAEWMSRCAIFVLASRIEAMGRVLIEAAAAGKCRVATRVGGIPTVVEHGSDGLLVARENVAELAGVLERLMSDAPLREQLGRAAKQRVDQEFTETAYLHHFEELIAATLAASTNA